MTSQSRDVIGNVTIQPPWTLSYSSQ